MEGSDIWLYCEVNSVDPTLTVKWMKDDIPLIQDIPHIRMRAVSSSTFLLIVDNFQASDSGTYRCEAHIGGEESGDNNTVGSPLTLRGNLEHGQCQHDQPAECQLPIQQVNVD